MFEPNPERRLVPQRVFFLLRPSLALLLDLHIEIPEDTRQDGSHFEVRKAESRSHVRSYHRCYSSRVDEVREKKLTSSRDSL